MDCGVEEEKGTGFGRGEEMSVAKRCCYMYAFLGMEVG